MLILIVVADLGFVVVVDVVIGFVVVDVEAGSVGVDGFVAVNVVVFGYFVV